MKPQIKSILLFLILLTISEVSIAQTKISVQGVIRQSDGNAIEDGLYPITFKLYDASINGNLLWTEIQPNVKVTSGIYSTILGSVTTLDLEFDEFYFLSLTVEGEELLPRAPLTSAPYANSMIGFDNKFPSTGSVGIGTLAPSEKLEVVGNAVISDTLAVGTSSPQEHFHVVGRTRLDGQSTLNGNVTINAPDIYMHNANGNAFFTMTTGSQGSQAFARDGSGNAILENTHPSGHMRFATDGTERMRILPNGDVGIGISGPSSKLHINGVGTSNQSSWNTSSDERVKKNINNLAGGSLQKIMQLRPVNYQWIEDYRSVNTGLKENNTGFIAQEVEQIFPEMIDIIEEQFGDKTIEDFRQLNLSDLPVHLVKAMQEQQSQIEALQAENEKLTKALTTQANLSEARFTELEASIKSLIQAQSDSKL